MPSTVFKIQPRVGVQERLQDDGSVAGCEGDLSALFLPSMEDDVGGRYEASHDISPAVLEGWERRCEEAGLELGDLLVASWGLVLSRYLRWDRVAVGRLDDGSSGVTILEAGTRVRVAHFLQSAGQRGGGEAVSPDTAAGCLAQHRPEGIALSVGLRSVASGSYLWLNADLGKFPRAFLARLLGHLEHVLEALASAEGSRLGEIAIVSKAELQSLVQAGVGDVRAWPCATALELFRSTELASPDAVAVRGTVGETLTFAELGHASRRLAHVLIAEGLQPGQAVAVLARRHPDSMVAMLGTMLAGGVYLPISLGQPAERAALILEDAGCRIGLAPTGDAGVLADLPRLIDPGDPQTGEVPNASLPEVGPRDPAYMMFTSGSTGRPKGVANTHRGLCNLAYGCAGFWGLGAADRMLQFVDLGFDVSMEELWSAWAVGARVVLANDAARADLHALVDFVDETGATMIHMASAHWATLVGALDKGGLSLPASLRLWVVGGEQVSPWAMQRWQELVGDQISFFVEYGLTEAAVTSLIYPTNDLTLSDGGVVPVGHPLPNVRVLVVDQAGFPQAYGLPGEMVLFGAGVAPGYLGKGTVDGYALDPLDRAGEDWVFATGDLMVLEEDGNFRYRGRLDRQRKVRGHRMELSEVESVLLDHPAVHEALVLSSGDLGLPEGDGPYAYVGLGGGAASERELVGWMSDRLPEFMIPSWICPLPELPRTVSEKVAMNKLPKPSDRRAAGKAEEGDLPEDPVQECVLRSVRTVLGKDDIYLSDGFFAAGGDSLRWMQLLLELEASGLQAEAEDIIASSDLRELSAAVSRRTYGAEDGRVWSPVLPLRTGAAGEPIVFMHVTPGDVMAYASVVDALGPQNPCYGVISPGLRADGALPESFSAMAEGYAEELLKSDVKAPYHLAGWCFGGVLAFEVARHLEARGAAIAGLYLIETPCPEMLASRVSRLRWRIACALHGGPDAVLDLAFRRLRETPGFGTAAGPGEGGELDLDEEYFLERTEIHMANMRALQNYRPGHFGGKVTLLCSEQRIDHDAMGWRFGKCADEIEVVTLPGSHVGVLHQEGAIKIANELAQRASGR